MTPSTAPAEPQAPPTPEMQALAAIVADETARARDLVTDLPTPALTVLYDSARILRGICRSEIEFRRRSAPTAEDR